MLELHGRGDPAGDRRGDGDVYDYCVDDPVTMADPTGLWTQETFDESRVSRDEEGKFTAGGGEEPEFSFADAFVAGWGNAWPSAKDFAGNLYGAVMSPGQTAEGVYNIIAGYTCQLFGKESEYRAYSDAMTQYILNRYGSVANLKKAIADDPVGVAGDISTIFTGGWGLLRGTAKVGAMTSRVLPAGSAIAKSVESAAGALRKAGNTAGAVGTVVDPLYMPGKIIGKVGQYIPVPTFIRKHLPKIATGISRTKTAIGFGGTQHAIDDESKKKDK